MPGGRPRLYKTVEEKKAANRAKTKKFYDLNKEELNEAKRNKRRVRRDAVKPAKPRTPRTPQKPQTKAREPLLTTHRSEKAVATAVAQPSTGDTHPRSSTISPKPSQPPPSQPPPSQPPTFELLNSKRVSNTWEQLAEAVNSRPLVEYLTWICESFAERQETDLEAAGWLFRDEETKLNRIHELIRTYETEAYTLEGCGKSWKEWQVLRVKVQGYQRELCEIECEALIGPGQLAQDFRRKALPFQRPSFSG
ncbi:hypothetical protein DFP72DRAFT_1064304 [Ephemerocybe angulata]|uniref:Uncharacterized protein n=1 Tax=Ephemerocybe angulata TaxID=980116 RepID=A0A8H6I4M2_9AGAR|nr:hypothetical protein DFP72DRAFT_1064304 [Tulosesus angulatus]